METPMFAKAMDVKEVDGKLYVDLELLVELLFMIANQSTLAATQLRDARLGVMALGVTQIGKGLDEALTLQKEAHGLLDPPKPCGLTQSHPAHSRLVGRKKVRCAGVAEQE